MDCKNLFDNLLQGHFDKLKEEINNLQIAFGLPEEQIIKLIISFEQFSLSSTDFIELASELLQYNTGPVEREPLPPYREKLHPRKNWQQKPYWDRVRSNPIKRGYH